MLVCCLGQMADGENISGQLVRRLPDGGADGPPSSPVDRMRTGSMDIESVPSLDAADVGPLVRHELH